MRNFFETLNFDVSIFLSEWGLASNKALVHVIF